MGKKTRIGIHAERREKFRLVFPWEFRALDLGFYSKRMNESINSYIKTEYIHI